MRLPRFTGRELPIEPPFSFKGVNTCVFPLRASLNALQLLCDQYLNIIPKQLGHFQASIPYVYLMILDYGKLALQATNLGWFAQREVVFTVPVEWYRRIAGEWVFQEWAAFCPFVYVDDTLSMTLGRSVLGWPKTFVNARHRAASWMRDPGGLTTDVALSASVFPKAYAGQRQEDRVFLEVRSPGSQGLRVPPNPDNPLFPWTMFSNLARNVFCSTRDYVELLNGLGILPWHEASGPANTWRRVSRAARQMFPFAPNFSVTTLNLKQFRSVENPERYCYQALTSGPLRYTAFNRGGLLGDVATWAGDSTANYSIMLTSYPSMPIVETLGLEVERRLTDDDVQFLELKPVMPFWYNVDMQYERATSVAWRSDDGIWCDECGGRYEPEGGSCAPGEDRFNTTLGASSPVIPGPFYFPSVITYVLPLLARRRQLQDYVNEKLNAPLAATGERFEVWSLDAEGGEDEHAAAYVYLVFSNYGQVQSRRNNVGDWADLCLGFYVPVQRFRDGAPKGVGFSPVVAFSDKVSQACTLSELYGMAAIKADFSTARGSWIERNAGSRFEVLGVRAEILPALGEGQQTRSGTVISIKAFNKSEMSREPGLQSGARGEQSPRSTALKAEYERLKESDRARSKRLQALASDEELEAALASVDDVLGGKKPWRVFTLMQIRDAAEPSRACYQALHEIHHTIRENKETRVIRDDVYVDIFDYPSLPIVRDLGLVPDERNELGGAVVYRFPAVSPFVFRHSFEEDEHGFERGDHRARRICYRSGTHEWHHPPDPPPPERPKKYAASDGSTSDKAPARIPQPDPRSTRARDPQTLLRTWLLHEGDEGD